MISYGSLTKIDGHLTRFGIVMWVSVLVGTIVPAIVAYQNKVFYHQDTERRIVENNVQPAAQIEKEKDSIRRSVQSLDGQIGDALVLRQDSGQAVRLTALRHQMEDELSRLDQKLVVGPFFLNDLMVGWSAMYIALGTLLFVVMPKFEGRFSRVGWKIAFAVFALYPLYQGPVWLRNFFLTNEERRVYSFANRDICSPSFWMQEINTVIWLLLIIFLWHGWLLLYKHRNQELSRNADAPLDMKTLTRLSDTFLYWQLSSVILALGFMVFTGVFWNLVIVDADRRYLVPAVVVHLIWAISWALLTLPLFVTWQDFSRKKMKMLLAKTQPKNEEPAEPAFEPEDLEKLTPIALWNGFGSALTAALSFVFPILHALIK